MTDQEIEEKNEEIERLRKRIRQLQQNFYMYRYRHSKDSTEQNLWDLSKIGVEKLLDLAKELIRTANSNPVVGYVIGFIITDVLYHGKIIDKGTAAIINTSLGIMMGAEVGGSILRDFTDITDVFGKGGTTNKEFLPSAKTIVYADNSSNSQLIRALQSREGLEG
ncbi:MAG: hypothetical protein QXH07_07165 [Thermoplasmata archaeon]